MKIDKMGYCTCVYYERTEGLQGVDGAALGVKSLVMGFRGCSGLLAEGVWSVLG